MDFRAGISNASWVRRIVMTSLRRTLLVVFAFAIAHGVEACATENEQGAELNPQPLPPNEDNKTTQTPEERAPVPGGGSSSGTGAGSTSSSGGPANMDADAGDGGVDSSGGDG